MRYNNDYTVCIILEIQTVPFRIRSRSLFLSFRPPPFISTAYLHLSPRSFPVYTACINRPTTHRRGFAHRGPLYSGHGCKSCRMPFLRKRLIFRRKSTEPLRLKRDFRSARPGCQAMTIKNRLISSIGLGLFLISALAFSDALQTLYLTPLVSTHHSIPSLAA